MRRVSVVLALLCSSWLFLRSVATAAITIATVPVGNPSNANDPATGLGEVDYNYAIGKYDVTVGQYTAFLNAVATTDTYGLYADPYMATALNIAGISRSGSPGSYIYSVIGSANHPIVYVSWGNAARFANWLCNGQPAGAEGPETTETGAYALNGATTDAALSAVTRNAGATWFLPTENEWYKAAYYNMGTSSYYKYPFSSNTVPTSAPPGSTPNTANVYDFTTGYAITGSKFDDPGKNYLTDVGAYAASASPYGAFDMGGDAVQWNETMIGSSFRGVRGASWELSFNFLATSSTFIFDDPQYGTEDIGFRVATVPEPSTILLFGTGAAAIVSVRAFRKQFAGHQEASGTAEAG